MTHWALVGSKQKKGKVQPFWELETMLISSSIEADHITTFDDACQRSLGINVPSDVLFLC